MEGQQPIPGFLGPWWNHRDRCPCPDCVSGRKHKLSPPDKLGGRTCYVCLCYYLTTREARRSPCTKEDYDYGRDTPGNS